MNKDVTWLITILAIVSFMCFVSEVAGPGEKIVASIFGVMAGLLSYLAWHGYRREA